MSEKQVMIPHHPDEPVWYQKWRPKTLDETILPKAFKESLKNYIKDGKIPSLLFYSPSPGTGKTTTALAVCHEMGIRPLFINASKDNDVETIRTRVLDYATTMSVLGSGFKVVILDEGERLSAAAQDSLKGLMEQVSKKCSFIITTNSKTKLVEPLISRCEEIDFMYDSDQMVEINALMLGRCIDILDAEGIKYDLNSLLALVKDTAPDNRKILVQLQSLTKRYGEINNAALQRAGSDMIATLSAALKEKNFKAVNDWCMDNYERMGGDIYPTLYKSLTGLVDQQSIPSLILTINDFQRHHNTVPDRYVHALAMCTTIMIEVKFK